MVLAMQRIQGMAAEWAAASDRRAIFADAYGRMTAAMVNAIAAAEFVEEEWVTRLLDRFAEYYFVAVEAHDQKIDRCPVVWSDAFDACGHAGHHPLQVLLLGVNAHINYDLVFTLADVLDDWHELDPARRRSRYADHELVNDVIARTIDEVQHEVVAVWSPEMATVDAAFGRMDEWFFSRLIAGWREEVWRHAIRLLEAPTAERKSVAEEVSSRAGRIATLVTTF